MSFKLSLLIEHNEWITWWKLKKVIIFFELLPFVILDRENLIPEKLLQLGGSNLGSW